MKTSLSKAPLAVLVAALLSGCSPHKPTAEALRPVRTVEVRYNTALQANRYVGTVQARHEVDQGFRVGGKVVTRKVDVGQLVREGDVLAILDDTDYRLAEQAARQQLLAAQTQAAQAASDRKRLDALKLAYEYRKYNGRGGVSPRLYSFVSAPRGLQWLGPCAGRHCRRPNPAAAPPG